MLSILDAFFTLVADIITFVDSASKAPILHRFKVTTKEALIVKAGLGIILLLSIYLLKHALGRIFLKWLLCERRVGPLDANGSHIRIHFELIRFNFHYSIWVPKTCTELLVQFFR